MMRNRPEYAAIWLGLTRIGAVVALIGPDLEGAALGACARRLRRAPSPSPRREARRRCGEAGYEGAVWTFGARRAPARRGGRPLFRRPSRRTATRPRVTLDDRALAHLHLRHDRPAEGGGGQPSQDRHLDALVLRPRRPDRRGPALRLPADASQRRRRRRASARRWLQAARRRSRRNSRRPVLGRRRALGLHGVPIYRRALPLSRRGADPHSRAARRAAAGARQRLARRRSGPTSRSAFRSVRVLEFYASTEGNVWLYNVEGRLGALGRLPPFVAAKAPLALVRFDEDAQAPARGEDGFCVAAPTTSRARRWGASPATRPRGSRATATPPRPRRKSCATCSRKATPGCAPAI